MAILGRDNTIKTGGIRSGCAVGEDDRRTVGSEIRKVQPRNRIGSEVGRCLDVIAEIGSESDVEDKSTGKPAEWRGDLRVWRGKIGGQHTKIELAAVTGGCRSSGADIFSRIIAAGVGVGEKGIARSARRHTDGAKIDLAFHEIVIVRTGVTIEINEVSAVGQAVEISLYDSTA